MKILQITDYGEYCRHASNPDHAIRSGCIKHSKPIHLEILRAHSCTHLATVILEKGVNTGGFIKAKAKY